MKWINWNKVLVNKNQNGPKIKIFILLSYKGIDSIELFFSFCWWKEEFLKLFFWSFSNPISLISFDIKIGIFLNISFVSELWENRKCTLRKFKTWRKKLSKKTWIFVLIKIVSLRFLRLICCQALQIFETFFAEIPNWRSFRVSET